MKHSALLALLFLLLSPVLVRGDDPKPTLAAALQSARQAQSQGQPDKALKHYQGWLRGYLKEARPQTAQALLDHAKLLEARGDLLEAKRNYRRVLDWFPDQLTRSRLAEARLRALRESGGSFLEEVLQKASKARGLSKARALKTVISEGTLKIAQKSVKFTRKLCFEPVRIREDAPQLQLSKAWDGQQGWFQKGQNVTVLRGPALDRTVDWAYENVNAWLGKHDGECRYGGQTRVLGKRAYRIEYRDGLDVWREDLDAETYLPLRAQGRQVNANGRMANMTLYYSKWSVKNGIAVPGRIEYYQGDDLAYEFWFRSYEFDKPLKATDFTAPKKP